MPKQDKQPRLSPEEIRELKAALAEWQTPAQMSNAASEANSQIGAEVFFNQAGLGFLRDAWVAASFGDAIGAKKVRLVADRWPDFEIEHDSQLEAFEIVEADAPNRRRGEEYRGTPRGIEEDPVEDWEARAEDAPNWIRAACEKKAGKGYDTTAEASLLVYLNMNEFGIRQEEVESSFADATGAAKDAFAAVWVLWKSKAYRVWEGGQRT